MDIADLKSMPNLIYNTTLDIVLLMICLDLKGIDL